ncbi:MAG TPA: hypothetical protein DHU55_14245 [Blastocatellia bacterium]|nr:hypothetical protein [Blastocatellia bacterium]HCX30908.1 hypothetical protein [Blastocatellia bacterium]
MRGLEGEFNGAAAKEKGHDREASGLEVEVALEEVPRQQAKASGGEIDVARFCLENVIGHLV